MNREVPFSIEGLGLVPDGFYCDAERIIETIPDEWDTVMIRPELVRNKNGWPTEYLGAAFYFLKADTYVAFILEAPDLFHESRLDQVRHAFERAKVA